jgi:anti-sigma regulatory factor (Ser/Thr protein kinase)
VTFYDDAEGFLASAMPFLREGLEAGEPALAALGSEKTELLRGELGADAEAIAFADIEEFGRNPARIIPAWQDFLDLHGREGAGVRGLGEPIWQRRSSAEVDECERHESLLNLAFADGPGWALLCPYDRSSLDDDVLECALLHHPVIATDGIGAANPEWDSHHPEPFAGALPPPPLDVAEIGFDRYTVQNLRAFVGLEAAEAGLSTERASDLVLAAGELANNSIVHGGGSGRGRIWREPEALLVEISDAGHILDPWVGRRRPAPEQERGRGLWIANQLCDLVQIRSGAGGTHVRLRMNLG